MDLKSSLLKVLTANFISLLAGVINGFLVPKFLKIDQYAMLQLYTLYSGYLGILSFGFVDGVYLKYGGKEKVMLDQAELKYEHNFFLIFQIIMSMPILLLAILKKNFVILAIALSVVPVSIQGYFSFLYQSLGEMGMFAKIKILHPLIILISNLVLIFLIRINNYMPFVAAILLSNYMVYFILEMGYLRSTKAVQSKRTKVNPLFQSGFLIMLGNLSSMFFYSIDRWFVKFLLPIENFSYYSFAVSMMSIILVLVSSVAMTFYPYLSKGYGVEQIRKIKKYLIIIGAIASDAYFVLAIVVTNFLSKYRPSLEVIAILFAGFPAIAVINALYINLYKVNKQERKYFYKVFTMLIVSFAFNVCAVLINLSNFSIAVATTIAFYFWFFTSSRDFDGVETNIKEITFISLYVPLFIFSSHFLGYISGFFVFTISIILLTLCFYRDEFFELISKIFRHESA